MTGPGPSTVACRNCGALNEAGFERCIRCNQRLGDAEPAEKARRRVPAKRRRQGAGALSGPGAEPFLGRFPAEQLPGVKLIILLNAMVFTLQLMGALTRGADIGTAVGASGGSMEAFLYGAMFNAPIFEGYSPFAEPWRMLSACFVHYGILHIGMNMYALLQLSRQVEPAVGTIRYIIIYVASGIAGFALSAVWNYLLFPYGGASAGASGAVFGMIGAVAGVLWRQGAPAWKGAATRAVVGFGVLAILPVNLDNTAHGGGMVVGALLGAALSGGAPRPSAGWQRGLAFVLLLACLGAIIAPRFSPFYQPMLREIGRQAQS